ncbi:branched-chain amino acid aminotransferase [Streptomyces liliifuscus]|uniref:Branched-chain-amino-acid aminotransferase n=1 Tax=Streptomyces liliifuscus TaxID=2797636 RepID=A0A7T7RH06_9ACTN|nr:branched-chain amino acid aminotransferase [Streptomyces liliifuscus]
MEGEDTVPTTTDATAFRISRTSTPLSPAEREKRMTAPGFGRVLTEHMVSGRWAKGQGWHDLRLSPYGPLEMDPATAALHYGQIVFEGLKAHRLHDGSVGVFRPHAHARRFQRSARRLVMPEMDTGMFVRSLEELVRADRAWVPDQTGHSLYLRPVLYAEEAVLALRPAYEYRFLLMAFVTEGFFNDDLNPVTVWVSTRFARAARGGTGDVKIPGNYAGAFAAQVEAAEHGCHQVVWLDSIERRWVEEMGGMNLFFVHGRGAGTRLTTPPLTGTLLPGVTRDALLTLLPEHGLPVEEVPLAIDDWQELCASGEITEVFACGTAAGVTPVGTVRSAETRWDVADGNAGPVTRRVAELLAAVRHGSLPERHGWMHRVT